MSPFVFFFSDPGVSLGIHIAMNQHAQLPPESLPPGCHSVRSCPCFNHQSARDSSWLLQSSLGSFSAFSPSCVGISPGQSLWFISFPRAMPARVWGEAPLPGISQTCISTVVLPNPCPDSALETIVSQDALKASLSSRWICLGAVRMPGSTYSQWKEACVWYPAEFIEQDDTGHSALGCPFPQSDPPRVDGDQASD